MFSPPKMRSLDVSLPAATKWHIETGRKREPKRDLVSYRRALDRLKSDEVNWLPFGPNPARVHPITLFRGLIYSPSVIEPYMPDRFLRQFGYAHLISDRVFQPKNCNRGPEIRKYSCVYDIYFMAWKMYKSRMLRGYRGLSGLIRRALSTSTTSRRDRTFVLVLTTWKWKRHRIPDSYQRLRIYNI